MTTNHAILSFKSLLVLYANCRFWNLSRKAALLKESFILSTADRGHRAFDFIFERVCRQQISWLEIGYCCNSHAPYAMCWTLHYNLHKIRQNKLIFLWESTDQKRKFHLIKWDLVTQDEFRGGLGLKKSLPKINNSLILIGWFVGCFLTKSHAGWPHSQTWRKDSVANVWTLGDYDLENFLLRFSTIY